jgi:predicted transcriptional regulator
VITGAQIRQARKLLGWEPSKLARRAKVHSLIVERAESAAFEPPITAYQAALIKQALVNAGVEFTNGNEPSVKLKAKGKMPRFAEPA